MNVFRQTMFKLSPRIRPRYEALGLLAFKHLPFAPELTATDLLRK